MSSNQNKSVIRLSFMHFHPLWLVFVSYVMQLLSPFHPPLAPVCWIMQMAFLRVVN